MAQPSSESIASVSVIIPVFRDAPRAVNAVRRVLAQDLPNGVALHVIVVDDGSGDDTVQFLRRELPSLAQLIELPENRGRSGARQAGIDAATGDVMLLLDSDCEPVGPAFLGNHLEQMTEDVVATVGPVIGVGGDFWDLYQRRASRRRRDQFLQGATYTGSTQNMMLRSRVLREVGGFDLRYRHYGFEDRDLLIRLSTSGKIKWCDNAIVRHTDRLTLAGVAAKMRTAGRESSRLFATQHPAEYQALGYARIDARTHPWLRLPGWALGKPMALVARGFDALEERGLMPWMLGYPLAKAASAVSYLAGTSEAADRAAHSGAAVAAEPEDLAEP